MNAYRGFSRFVDFAPGQRYSNNQLPVPYLNIERRTGIVSRNIAAQDDSIESIAYEAAKILFEKLNIKAKDCAGLVLSTSAGNEQEQHEVTEMAKNVGHMLGIRSGAYAGVNFACSGFPAATQRALELAKNTERHILLITSEIMSRLVNWADESTAVLFADRAAATSIIEGGHTILDADAWVVDDEEDLIHLEKTESAISFTGETQNRFCMRMHGLPLYKRAPGSMIELMRNSMNRLNLQPSDIVALDPHQANGRFMDKIQNTLLEEDEDAWRHLWIISQIDQMGNVGCSSIPASLAQVQDYLMPGKIVVCPAIGAGCDFKRGTLSEGIVTFRMSEV